MLPDLAASPFFLAAAVLAAIGLILIFAGVDAHILKWKPVANVLGLHTAYELDRMAGRYRDIPQERSASRTIYQLSEERSVDLFGLRRRYEFLSPLLDAEYGSATFVPVSKPVELELRVSTSGLLIREAKAP